MNPDQTESDLGPNCLQYRLHKNGADPDEMWGYAAFHLALHCLPKYTFRGFQCTKG